MRTLPPKAPRRHFSKALIDHGKPSHSLRSRPSVASQNQLTSQHQLDKLVGLAMLVASSVVFLYYTVWTLLMVNSALHLVIRAMTNAPASPSSIPTTLSNTSSPLASGPSAFP